jgi:hypothetical protein
MSVRPDRSGHRTWAFTLLRKEKQQQQQQQQYY